MRIMQASPIHVVPAPESSSEEVDLRPEENIKVAPTANEQQDLLKKETEEGLKRLLRFVKEQKPKAKKETPPDQKKKRALRLYSEQMGQEEERSLKGASVNKAA